jgi:hypothetical protein
MPPVKRKCPPSDGHRTGKENCDVRNLSLRELAVNDRPLSHREGKRHFRKMIRIIIGLEVRR